MKTGTLKELNVKPGDVVEFVDWHDGYSDAGSFAYGKRYTITNDTADSGTGFFRLDTENIFRLISRATPEPKTWAEMTDAEKGALLLAHHEGKVIEICYPDDADWTEASSNFFWNKLLAYRFRPEPVRNVVTKFYQAGDSVFDTHRITFNLIDGEPDCASVKMERI